MTPDEQPGTPDPIDPQLQAEIDAALGEMSFGDIIENEAESGKRGGRPRRDGIIVSIRGTEVLIEFGPKLQGVCPLAQFDEAPKVGATETFVIDREDQAEGILFCSRPGEIQKAQWDTIDTGQIVEARCTGTNKGGLEMEVAGHPAFMPAGQVALHHVPDLTVFVGQKMPCEVIELDRKQNRMVLSRRGMLEAERAEARTKLMETLEPGKTLEALITSVKPYGAFADIGGLEGLIHVSEMGWDRIDDVSAIVKPGDNVMVQVLNIDHEHDPPRIALGMKQLTTDPFLSNLEGFSEGAVVTGTVKKLADFGAFVEIAPSLEGLVHISELSHERVKSTSDIVKEGQEVTVKVLSIDPATRRVALSIKQAGADPESQADRGEDPAMRKLKARFGDSPLKGGLG